MSPAMSMNPVNQGKEKQTQPVRTCCVRRAKALKIKLDRFVLEEGKPVQDVRKDKAGRGAYCCQDERCRAVFLSQQKRWKRALRVGNTTLGREKLSE